MNLKCCSDSQNRQLHKCFIRRAERKFNESVKSWSSGLWRRNVGILHHYSASQPRRPRLVSLSPWKPQITQWWLLSLRETEGRREGGRERERERVSEWVIRKEEDGSEVLQGRERHFICVRGQHYFCLCFLGIAHSFFCKSLLWQNRKRWEIFKI
jgi:hypothetical protein